MAPDSVVEYRFNLIESPVGEARTMSPLKAVVGVLVGGVGVEGVVGVLAAEDDADPPPPPQEITIAAPSATTMLRS